MNQPIGNAHHVSAAHHVAAAHHAVQMIQQSNRANQALVIRNQQRVRYFTVPQPELPTITELGLELDRAFEINQYKPVEGLIAFEVRIDGKQISLRLGEERMHGLLQCLMEIADQEGYAKPI